jgi:hypothetical protein
MYVLRERSYVTDLNLKTWDTDCSAEVDIDEVSKGASRSLFAMRDLYGSLQE